MATRKHVADTSLTVIAALLMLWLSACSNFETRPTPTAAIKVTIVDQDRIRFSGKGAGAGMMLMSSMGAMGIAIGVAIDEGIGKEIQDSFVTSGGHFSAMVEAETRAWLNTYCQQSANQIAALCKAEQALELNIYRYGFVTTSGEEDPVTPELDMSFVIEGKETRLNLKDLSEEGLTAPLEKIKKEGAVSAELLQNGFRSLLAQYGDSLGS